MRLIFVQRGKGFRAISYFSMVTRLCLSAIFTLLLISSLRAQHHYARNYTVRDGLPMTECIHAYCDRQGYIWTAHITGDLTRFDGHRFISYTPEITGVRPPDVAFRDDRRGLWVLQRMETITLFHNDTWRSFPAPGVYVIETDRTTDEIAGLDTFGRILRFDINTGGWVQAGSWPRSDSSGPPHLMYSPILNNYLLLQARQDHFEIVESAFSSSSLVQPDWKRLHDFDQKSKMTAASFIWHDISADTLRDIFGTASMVSDILQIHPTPSHLLFYTAHSIPEERRYRIIIYQMLDRGLFKEIATIKTREYVLNLMIDHFGYIWASSIGGLIRINPYRLDFHEDDPYMVTSLHAINEDDRGRIWFGGYTSGLSFWDGHSIQPPPSAISHVKDILPGAYRNVQGQMAFWSERKGLLLYEHGQWHIGHVEQFSPGYITGFYFLPLQNQNIAAGFSGHGMGITKTPLSIDPSWKMIGKSSGMQLDNVLTISEDAKGRLWAARPSQGLALYDPVQDTARTWLLNGDTDSLDFATQASLIDSDGRLWLGSYDGLRVIEAPADFQMWADDIKASARKVRLLETDDQRITSLFQYGKYIVFGHQTGYGFLDLDSYRRMPLNPAVYFFNTMDSGESAEQNAIYVDTRNHLWIGLDKAAIRLDMSKLQFDTLQVKLIPQYFRLMGGGADSILTFKDGFRITLPLHRRSGMLHVQTTFSPFLADNVGIQYRFISSESPDTLWSTYTTSRFIRFDFLPPGRNVVELRAIKNNQVHDVVQLHIHVPRTLQESPAFWVSLISILGLTGFFFTRQTWKNRMRVQAAEMKANKQQREKQHFQIQALVNSLNPHFIKNTLNWIQTRFRKDEEVVDVIARLSENIGTVFTHSRNGEAFHSLADELRLTENYLMIQQANYGSFFTLHFPPKEDIAEWGRLLVPLLQIQIHVENAIEHGLRMRTANRQLSIELIDHGQYVYAVITDNGIGRAAAKARGRRSTGHGTNMIRHIYDIYNPVNQYHFSYHYDDLRDPVTGEAAGTRVTIRIPKQYHTQLS